MFGLRAPLREVGAVSVDQDDRHFARITAVIDVEASVPAIDVIGEGSTSDSTSASMRSASSSRVSRNRS
jgi:hypothetical protein